MLPMNEATMARTRGIMMDIYQKVDKSVQADAFREFIRWKNPVVW